MAIMALFIGLVLLPILVPTTQAERLERTSVAQSQAQMPPAREKGAFGFLKRFISLEEPQFSQEQDKKIVLNAAGQPGVLNAASALSAAVMTTFGGRDSQFSEVSLLASWDGREDFAAEPHAESGRLLVFRGRD